MWDMAKVDSKGRVTIPKEVRESLEIGEGSHVSIRTDEGRIVVEPERDPDDIIEEMESLIEGMEREESGRERSLISEGHVEDVREQAEDAG